MPTRLSILRTACSTVVWSRPPNRRPISGKERVVSFHVYSLPFDSCVVFDVAQGQCRRKDLAFDSAPVGYDVRMR